MDELQKVYELLSDVFDTDDFWNDAGAIQLCYHYTTTHGNINGRPYTGYSSERADKAENALKELRKMTENRKGLNQKGPDQTAGLKAEITKLSGQKRKAEKEVFDLKQELKQSYVTYDGLVSRVGDLIEAGNGLSDELKDLRKKHKDLGQSVFDNFRKARDLD